MSSDPNGPAPRLRLVTADDRMGVEVKPGRRALDWAILMAHAQDGDRVAYQRLLQEITPYLRSLAARRCNDRSDIEDAVQDVLLTIHSIRHTYDPTRPFAPWLVTIANRRLIDRMRRQIRQRGREIALAPEHEVAAEPETGVEATPDRRELERAIDILPPAQQQAVRLLKLKELSLKEASAATGMSTTSLKVNMHRALKSLQKLLMPRDEP
ncbi:MULTISPECIES: sigma-70 family RNA polymerase sigma factor [unclassified Bradyrhizobium]|uniref:sigma-70 family RNA polymerase sigma factor n=1 Tax=unclassified Bradyrhizobium TaxID=2631580 RepID=UPI0028EAE1A2|nr:MULTISPECIES: sigma-70 family RNA polymerase sigma factor [unclassified Bradyrhizobium]